MNTDNETIYDPADDDNQGVAQLLAQGAEAGPGVAQVERMNPVTASGPEPEKAEVNDPDGDGSLNDDVLAEEETEDGELQVDNN